LPFRDAFTLLHTPDLSRASAFYQERFGFEERYRFPEDESPKFVVVGLGAFSLGLTAVEEVEPGGRVQFWLYCDDVDAEIESLREAGVEITREPEDRPWGERMAVISDPDGNEVYLGQPAASG
jgi:lactoylglutathione lyase